jgi:hypothetical protein
MKLRIANNVGLNIQSLIQEIHLQLLFTHRFLGFKLDA